MTQQEEYRIDYGSTSIVFSVLKSRRVKTSEIIVEPDKVVVRVPYDKPVHEIRQVIQNKARWIVRKQLEYKKNVSQIIIPTFQNGSTLPFFGNNYRIKIIHDNRERIELANGHFLVFLNTSVDSKTKTKRLYERWLKATAEDFAFKKTNLYSKQLDVTPKGIRFRNLKSRWGSMSTRGILTLNTNLFKAPPDVIDYMILHELCHLKIKEHSHKFWGLVHKFIPNYEDKINWLKLNGNNLMSS